MAKLRSNRLLTRGRLGITVVLSLAALTMATALPGMTASAQKLNRKTAIAATYSAVAKLGRETRASGTHVLGCRRSSAVKWFCQGENRFRTGAKRCVADVIVTSRRARLRAKIEQYLCY